MLPNNVVIILPTFNRENVILRCAVSIFNAVCHSRDRFQATIINVDDESNDSTSARLQSFCNTRPILRCIHFQCAHAGPAKARNIGIEYALAHFPSDSALLFIDSDDEIDIAFFDQLSNCWDGESIVSFVLGEAKEKPPIKEQGMNFVKRFFQSDDNHINCALWNRGYPLKLWQSVRLPSIPYFEDLGGLIPILMQPSTNVVLVSSYCGYKLNKDVPGATRCPPSNMYYRKWLLSLGYVSKINLPNSVAKLRDSYIAGYFLEIWPRYNCKEDRDWDIVFESIKRLKYRRFYLNYRPQTKKDRIKKWAFILLGAKCYSLIFKMAKKQNCPS